MEKTDPSNTSEENVFSITDEMLNRYHELNQQAKQIEQEMKELKKVFHAYFDSMEGQNAKGQTVIGDYLLQRQIRSSERYHEERTVQFLEELNLKDCIQIVKKPDEEKINAALILGLIKESDLEDCILKKISQAIIVKKVGG